MCQGHCLLIFLAVHFAICVRKKKRFCKNKFEKIPKLPFSAFVLNFQVSKHLQSLLIVHFLQNYVPNEENVEHFPEVYVRFRLVYCKHSLKILAYKVLAFSLSDQLFLSLFIFSRLFFYRR